MHRPRWLRLNHRPQFIFPSSRSRDVVPSLCSSCTQTSTTRTAYLSLHAGGAQRNSQLPFCSARLVSPLPRAPARHVSFAARRSMLFLDLGAEGLVRAGSRRAVLLGPGSHHQGLVLVHVHEGRPRIARSRYVLTTKVARSRSPPSMKRSLTPRIQIVQDGLVREDLLVRVAC